MELFQLQTQMKRILYTALAALSLVAPPLKAASDFLLELDGIKGESSDTAVQGAIEILSFSWGASNPAVLRTGGGAVAGKVSFQDMHFTNKSVSKASPVLFLKCASGQHIKKAVLHVRKAGTSETYLKITLTDILVSSYQHKDSGNTAAPAQSESFSLNFTKIEFSYKEAGGAVTSANWDLNTNTGGVTQ